MSIGNTVNKVSPLCLFEECDEVICEGYMNVTGNNNVFTVVFNSWCPCIYHYTILSESTGPSSLWHVINRY